MNDKRTFKPRHLSDRGSILVIVIAGIAVASVIVGSYLLFIDDQRERSARGGDDTVTQIRLEENVFRIQREIELGVTTKGEIDLPEISSDMRSLPDALSSPAWLKLTLNGYEGGIASIESFASPSTSLASLENHGDPFLRARASVLSVGIESSAFTLMNIQSRLSYKKVVLTPRIDVRAIPVSQFTVFSLGSGLDIDSANFAGPVGRIFASRDIQFSGNFSTNYPIVSGGSISMEEPLTVSLDANSPIQFRSGQIAYAQPGDSNQAAWLAEARTQYNSTIINPGSLPISLSLPPVANGTASKPAENAGSGLDLATIRNRCDLLVLVHAGIRGSYQITAVRGNSAWLLPDAQLEGSGATINPHPAANVRQSSKRAGRQDSPVVVSEVRTIGMNKQVVTAFNYGALRSEARQQIHTIYFEFDGSITDAAVLVRGARILQDGFTIASRWPVLVAGDFNAGQNPAAASILTAQAVRSVDSNFWNSIFGSAP
jgi:hypothetical protein